MPGTHAAASSMTRRGWHGAGGTATVALVMAVAASVSYAEPPHGRSGSSVLGLRARSSGRPLEPQRLRRELQRAEEAVRLQRDVLRHVERSRRAEREWSRELRTQLQQLYASPRRRAGRRDVALLILQAAIELVGADRGMLLSREDGDRDGALDVVAAEGFEHDPSTSAVAQRFARQVLALDEIVREDAPARRRRRAHARRQGDRVARRRSGLPARSIQWRDRVREPSRRVRGRRRRRAARARRSGRRGAASRPDRAPRSGRSTTRRSVRSWRR